MQLTNAGLEDYISRVAELLERYGVVLDLQPDQDLVLDQSPSGAVSFEVRGFLPDGRKPPRSTLELREVWRPVAAGELERAEYEFELLDHERDIRRAFHRHDVDVFIRRFQVVVHEHCERPIGSAPCPHGAGNPVRDAYGGVELLVGLWVHPGVTDCAAMRCLD